MKSIKYRLTALALAAVVAVPELFGNFSCATKKVLAVQCEERNVYENDLSEDEITELPSLENVKTTNNKEKEDVALEESENACIEVNENYDESNNEVSEGENVDMPYGSSDGLSGTKTSSSDDFNISSSVINYMKKHGSSTSLGNYPYYLVIPKNYTLKEYAFTGDASKSNNLNNAEHVSNGCCYFAELYCKAPSEAILTTLPEGAFYSCSGLSSIRQMPEKLNKIEKLCFAKNVSLTTANFCGTELNIISDSAFEDDVQLNNILWDGGAILGDKTFYNDCRLKEVGKIKSIGKSCFENCSLLSNVELTGIIPIPERAFYNCTSMAGDMTVGSVGKEAFENCENLSKITVNGNVAADAFKNCKELSEATISGTVSAGCFDDCKRLKSLTFKGDVPDGLCQSLNMLSKVSITDAVKIGVSAFMFDDSLSNMDFSNCKALQEIGEQAFLGTNLVGGIQIPQAVTQISDEAFYDAMLPSVYFNNNGVVNIGKEAFAKNNISELDIHKAQIDEKAFADNPIVNVTLGSGITQIGEEAFYNEKTLKTVKINGIPGQIDENGIFNNSSITNITLDENINKIQDNLFRNAGFGDVDISFAADSKLTTIGNNAFKNAIGLKSIILPDSITTIGECAFDDITAPEGFEFYVLIKENSPVESIIKKYNAHNEKSILYKILLSNGTIVEPNEDNSNKKEDNIPTKEDEAKNEEESDNIPENAEDEHKKENENIDESSDNIFTIKTNYYKEYLKINIKTDIDEKNRYSNELISENDGGKIASRTDVYSSEGNQAVTYEFIPIEGAVITDVYIDSIDKGSIDSYTFADGYDHIISINIKYSNTEETKQLDTFDPFAVATEYYIDIAYHPEKVSVIGPDSPHILFSNGKYSFVRYYFLSAIDKNIVERNFVFNEKGNDKITKVYIDGNEADDKHSLKLKDEKYHLIVIENENSSEITKNPEIPKEPTASEPDYREFDDDGNPIDKTKPRHTISYVLNGGQNSPYNIKYYYEGSVFYFREAKKEGYDFKGWYLNDTKIVSTKNQNANLKLKALYNPKGYSITYIMNGGVFKKASSVTYSYNVKKTVKLKKPKKAGYKFIGWFYGDMKMTKLRKNDSTKGNIILVAHWAPNDYSIKFSGNGGKGKMVKITNCAYNQYINLPGNTFKKDGYVFSCWNTKKNGTGASYKDLDKVKGLKQKGTVTLYAQWTKAK